MVIHHEKRAEDGIAGTIHMRDGLIEGEGWIIAAGIASILFGVLLIARPGAGALALITVIGAYATVFGILLVLGAFKLKKFATA